MTASERDDITEYVRRSREAQGLPPTIEDAETLRAVADLLVDAARVSKASA